GEVARAPPPQGRNGRAARLTVPILPSSLLFSLLSHAAQLFLCTPRRHWLIKGSRRPAFGRGAGPLRAGWGGSVSNRSSSMLRSWYQKRATNKAHTGGPRRRPTSRRPWRWQPRLESLEARLVLYDHVWSDGSCFLNCSTDWSDPGNWSNGSPAGDPDPEG